MVSLPALARLAGLASIIGFLLPGVASAVPVTRVSVASGGGQSDGGGQGPPAFSAGGRFVAFPSSATNLVAGDTNAAEDVYVRDVVADTTTRASVASAGVQGNADSGGLVAISRDGSIIAFTSSATNLVSGDTNGVQDVFVHNFATGRTRRVSVSSLGAQGDGESYLQGMSADGRLIVFGSDASNLVRGDSNFSTDIFVRNRATGRTRRISLSSTGRQAGGQSYEAAVSASGRVIAFVSTASNLVPHDTNHVEDVFVRDRVAHTTHRVSVSSNGQQANAFSEAIAIAADGHFVAFDSEASNLVPGDTNHTADVFVRNRLRGVTRRVSISSSGVQGNRFSGGIGYPAISGDGSLVAYDSSATNLVPGDSNGFDDIFVRNRLTGRTRRISTSSTGVQGNGDSEHPAIAPGATILGFDSHASNLVAADTNAATDVFAVGTLP